MAFGLLIVESRPYNYAKRLLQSKFSVVCSECGFLGLSPEYRHAHAAGREHEKACGGRYEVDLLSRERWVDGIDKANKGDS